MAVFSLTEIDHAVEHQQNEQQDEQQLASSRSQEEEAQGEDQYSGDEAAEGAPEDEGASPVLSAEPSQGGRLTANVLLLPTIVRRRVRRRRREEAAAAAAALKERRKSGRMSQTWSQGGRSTHDPSETGEDESSETGEATDVPAPVIATVDALVPDVPTAGPDASELERQLSSLFASTSTDEMKAQGLLLIRDVARKMPNTVLNRGYTEHILTWVHSRHKLLRPCAASALAALLSQRVGREALLRSRDVLSRLVAMTRCGFRSLDAHYAALALANWSLHPTCKDLIGQVGAIPALISLIRQAASQPTPEQLTLLRRLRDAPHTVTQSRPPGSPSRRARPPPTTHAENTSHTPTTPHTPNTHHHLPAISPTKATPASPTAHTNTHTDTATMERKASVGTGGASMQAMGPHGRMGSHNHQAHGAVEKPLRHAPSWVPVGLSDRELIWLEDQPSACHAATTLLNIAEKERNKRRMLAAGLPAVLETCMRCTKPGTLLQRCRLLATLLGITEVRSVAVAKALSRPGREPRPAKPVVAVMSVEPIPEGLEGDEALDVALQLGSILQVKDPEQEALVRKAERRKQRAGQQRAHGAGILPSLTSYSSHSPRSNPYLDSYTAHAQAHSPGHSRLQPTSAPSNSNSLPAVGSSAPQGPNGVRGRDHAVPITPSTHFVLRRDMFPPIGGELGGARTPQGRGQSRQARLQVPVVASPKAGTPPVQAQPGPRHASLSITVPSLPQLA